MTLTRGSRAIAAVPFVFAAACAEGSGPPICTATGECEESIHVSSSAHIDTGIVYPDPPPAGGPHASCWTTFGVHSTEVADDNWVHNQEHGGVVFLYHCPAGCDAEVATLTALVAGKSFAVLSSYSLMPERFAVTAWGHRLVTDTLDVDAFEAFYAAHVDHGPESSSGNPPSVCNPAP